MSTCKELLLNNIAEIVAIPVDDYSIDADYLLSPTIPSYRFSPSLRTAITVGVLPAWNGGKLIPIVHNTGGLLDEENDAVEGRSHQVDVNCDVDVRGFECAPYLQELENGAYHLLLTTIDRTNLFVAATKDSYTCMVNKQDKVSVKFSIHNFMGAQYIV